MNKISIIIPILNEVDYISKLLEQLIINSSPVNIAEIIVVDGGSTDGSLNSVRALRFLKPEGSVKIFSSEKGRAKQMNLGASKASGNILYFLHADSLPPQNFDQLIINEINKGNLAGCFRMQFDSNHWWLRLASWLTQFSWRACRGGDQSQFITKGLFENIGGYDENYIIYEDNILINELYKRKQFVVINKKIRTSARLYKKVGIWKLQYHFWSIYVKKWLGASAEELHNYYKNYISSKNIV
ncbi:TIGR04283 family arsenosugar biosynthesis glycosyltransferase [Ichthyenterobacterium sp. W332]|uniref:TIGR04283 family arsenosugar biosynthesis glycosyltransferase n=1 Tax=Microcosmobacter mediterraneus TaxID=3075607 RepID=A0ABU2YL18_9FLAO|nr:TIGR04283 family arsenosugar biosynthesis glycosyltransferase [Ichthyenterobacterium sp. W332]MDT0558512.1 TIGR04283 family arsenosugar biosynthesis glycosyltransferase [Ichthyenterobacterium sp. W332]